MRNNTENKLRVGVFVIVLLSISLVFTSAVLAMSTLPIQNNIFKTGMINIKLGSINGDNEYYFNDNHKLISENEFLFEPGITVEKKFFIENVTGSEDLGLYYKIYLSNVTGELANEIDICIKDENGIVYYKNKAKDFIEGNVPTANNMLKNLKHYYTISFHYPEECQNVGQGNILMFDFCAKAVQARNNSNKEFEYKE